MRIKSGSRVLALNGAPFRRDEGRELVIGLIGRTGIIEGSLSFFVEVDGSDSTERIIEAVKRSRFSDQIRTIAMNGVALGGLNVVDLEVLSKRLGVGVIVVTRKRPRRSLLKKALSKGPESKRKSETIDRIYKKVSLARIDGFYVQSLGLEQKTVGKMLEEVLSLLRLAHIVASGIGHGESRGRI